MCDSTEQHSRIAHAVLISGPAIITTVITITIITAIAIDYTTTAQCI